MLQFTVKNPESRKGSRMPVDSAGKPKSPCFDVLHVGKAIVITLTAVDKFVRERGKEGDMILIF